MLKRILLLLILLASISWLVIVSLDILSDKNKYDPKQLFGHEDEEVLIINRPAEINPGDLPSFQGSINTTLIEKLVPSSYEMAYVSKKRPHMLIIRKEGWDNEAIENLFGGVKTSETSSAQTILDYKIRYQKSKLYLWKGDIELGSPVDKINFDKKATATILQFNKEQKLETYTDIYFKEDGLINFVTRNTGDKIGNQVDDAFVFSAYLPSEIESYHFYERDYYSALDSVFTSGGLFRWTNKGFIDIQFKGERVIVSDYVDGQDPVLVLQDMSQVYDTNTFNLPLLHDYPAKGQNYTVKLLEDLVVISKKPSTCDQFIAAYKLGHTLALNEQSSNRIYGKLPTKVSERWVTKESQLSRTIYHGKILETRTGGAKSDDRNVVPATNNIACNFHISDFIVLPGKGNVVALGTNGEIAAFKNGKPTWKDKIDGSPMGKLQHVDLHGNGENFVLINTKDKIYLWEVNGNTITGFPVNLEEDAINEVKFYRWKGNSFFIVASVKELTQFDAKGRELNVIKTTLPITHKVDAWASQRRLFIGYRTDNHFFMYDMDKRRVHREFDLSASTATVKIPNELLQFNFVDDQLVKIDQKGIATRFGLFPEGKIIKTIDTYKNPMFVVQSMNQISLLNIDGIAFAKISLPFNEIADVDIYINDSGKTYIAVIDGLENNVYLYGVDGNLISKSPYEGQSKVKIKGDHSGKQITTIVDDFIIQYYEN